MRTLLERAYCEGVLVIGAAGNGTTTSAQAPVLPAALESDGGPDAGLRRQRCQDGIRRRGSEAACERLRAAHPLRRQRRPLRRAIADRARVGAPANRRLRDGRDGARAEAASTSRLAAARRCQQRRSAASQPTSGDAIPGLDAAQVMTAVYKGGRPAGDKEQGEPNGDAATTYGATIGAMAGRRVRATLCGALKKRSAGPAGVTASRRSPGAGRSRDGRDYFPPRPPGSADRRPTSMRHAASRTAAFRWARTRAGLAAVGPMGVATCGTCRLFRNGGNGMLTGSLNFNGAPPAWFYTTVILYDSNWAPHYY